MEYTKFEENVNHESVKITDELIRSICFKDAFPFHDIDDISIHDNLVFVFLPRNVNISSIDLDKIRDVFSDCGLSVFDFLIQIYYLNGMACLNLSFSVL